MEQASDWSLVDEIEDDDPITERTAQTVRDNAATGCLICLLDAWEDE